MGPGTSNPRKRRRKKALVKNPLDFIESPYNGPFRAESPVCAAINPVTLPVKQIDGQTSSSWVSPQMGYTPAPVSRAKTSSNRDSHRPRLKRDSLPRLRLLPVSEQPVCRETAKWDEGSVGEKENGREGICNFESPRRPTQALPKTSSLTESPKDTSLHSQGGPENICEDVRAEICTLKTSEQPAASMNSLRATPIRGEFGSLSRIEHKLSIAASSFGARLGLNFRAPARCSLHGLESEPATPCGIACSELGPEPPIALDFCTPDLTTNSSRAYHRESTRTRQSLGKKSGMTPHWLFLGGTPRLKEFVVLAKDTPL